MARINLKETATISTPTAGYGTIYYGTDKRAKVVDSAGAEFNLSRGIEGSQVISNNGSAVALTDFVVDSATYCAVKIDFTIMRTIDGTSIISTGTGWMRDRDGTWEWADGLRLFDADGVTFTITTALGVGTLKYTSSNISATTYVGLITYKATFFEV